MRGTTKPRNPDHVRRTNHPSPVDEVVRRRIEELLYPAVLRQIVYYRKLNMRNRVLNLPVTVACVVATIWMQMPSVCELARSLARDPLFWLEGPLTVTQQSLSQRFLQFPAELFERVLKDLLPSLRDRSEQRTRPLPPAIVHAQRSFSRILAVDCSTLEALFLKLQSLKEAPPGKLAGKICAIVDVVNRLPETFSFSEDAASSDFNFTEFILGYAQAGMLLLMDRGFLDYGFLDQLTDKGCFFITRVKSNTKITIQRVLPPVGGAYQALVLVGSKNSLYGQARHVMRLVEVKFGAKNPENTKNTKSYRYLTNVLDPKILPGLMVADLYRRRWRIEEAFMVAKRLFHLSYLWTGSVNGVLLQLWGTWLLYAVLVDLCDAVADKMNVYQDQISIEMVFRGLYHFAGARERGETDDPVEYFADPRNRDLGILKRPDKRRKPSLVAT